MSDLKVGPVIILREVGPGVAEVSILGKVFRPGPDAYISKLMKSHGFDAALEYLATGIPPGPNQLAAAATGRGVEYTGLYSGAPAKGPGTKLKQGSV